MDGLARLAADLDDAASDLADVARRLPGTVPSAAAYGTDAPGRPGEVGNALHARFAAALDARTREAVDTAARLTDAAHAVRLAADRYADVDEAVHRRRRREV